LKAVGKKGAMKCFKGRGSFHWKTPGKKKGRFAVIKNGCNRDVSGGTAIATSGKRNGREFSWSEGQEGHRRTRTTAKKSSTGVS